MTRQLVVFLGLALIALSGAIGCSPQKQTAEPQPAPAAEASRETPAFIQAIGEKVRGREELPAEEVFEDIQILKGIPAGRVLPIMRMAFSQSLGVRCNHCHVFNEWADNSKPAKQIAREMWEMTDRINRNLLAGIDNLSSGQPIVNCTTCHRGELKPALRME